MLLRTRRSRGAVSDYGFKTTGGSESRRGARTLAQARSAFGAGARRVAGNAVQQTRNRLLRRSGLRTRRQQRGV